MKKILSFFPWPGQEKGRRGRKGSAARRHSGPLRWLLFVREVSFFPLVAQGGDAAQSYRKRCTKKDMDCTRRHDGRSSQKICISFAPTPRRPPRNVVTTLVVAAKSYHRVYIQISFEESWAFGVRGQIIDFSDYRLSQLRFFILGTHNKCNYLWRWPRTIIQLCS